jgi:hypothetical protein
VYLAAAHSRFPRSQRNNLGLVKKADIGYPCLRQHNLYILRQQKRNEGSKLRSKSRRMSGRRQRGGYAGENRLGRRW